MPGGNLKFVHTSLLEIAYEDDGPRNGPPVMLLHGWPDAPRGWWLKPLMLKVPDFEQSKRFWYQWLQCIDGGAEAVDL
jgi:pimeloyl-ACP methyl ester carboxylesterase